MTLSIVRVSLYLFVLMFLAFTKFSSILSLLLACLFCSSHQHFCVTITGFSYDEFIVHLTSKWSHTSLNSESEGELNHRESTDLLPLRSPSYPSSCLQEITASQYRFCTEISHAWEVCSLGRRKATGGSLSHQGEQLKCKQVWAIPRQAL